MFTIQKVPSKPKIVLSVLLFMFIGLNAFCQHNSYEIYALKFATLNFKMPIAFSAVGSTSKDSTGICYMVYLLKGNNGRTILVDAGFTETLPKYNMQAFIYIRPDSILKQIHINLIQLTLPI